MKLYYSPGACSLAPHIVIHELGLKHDLEKVDLKAHKTESGQDFYDVNPKGYVPTLITDNGELLSEVIALLLYLGAQKPEKKLSVLPDDAAYVHQLEWLAFVSTEFHKGIGAAAWLPINDEAKQFFRANAEKRLDYVEKHLATNQFLLGDRFTVADAYLFTILNWSRGAKIDLSKWKNVSAYHARIGARDSVVAAMKMEGLQPIAKAA